MPVLLMLYLVTSFLFASGGAEWWCLRLYVYCWASYQDLHVCKIL